MSGSHIEVLSSSGRAEQAAEQGLDVSVVIPCLNEEESVATVVRKALAGIAAAGLSGEVVVADNNSTEVMVWTQNHGQAPSGSTMGRMTAGGHSFQVWKAGTYIAFVADQNFSSGTVDLLSIFKYDGFDMALDMVRQIFETGGKGHSCGIYSFDDDHIHRLALVAPVSRIMVRQVQSASNAGTFTNGMPMTSSMGCGIWGGNITNENISLKHYMNVTWVSRPLPEDRPSEQELFGEFYDSEIF